MTADPSILRAVRVQCGEAERHLQAACTLLRQNGWPENADDLTHTLKHLRVWTQRDGWLDSLERPRADTLAREDR